MTEQFSTKSGVNTPFEQFIRERQFISSLSPRTVEWYRESFAWLDNPEPTNDQLKSIVIRMRERGLKPASCNNRNHADAEESVTTWLFNDAPRQMRLAAIGKIPDLLEQLTAQAAHATTEAKTKLGLAKEVVGALKQASDQQPDIRAINSLSQLDLSMPGKGGKK